MKTFKEFLNEAKDKNFDNLISALEASNVKYEAVPKRTLGSAPHISIKDRGMEYHIFISTAGNSYILYEVPRGKSKMAIGNAKLTKAGAQKIVRELNKELNKITW